MTVRRWVVLFFVVPATVIAGTVNWQGPAGSTIKEIRYFEKDDPKPAAVAPMAEATSTVLSNVINSPPVDGFVPWIAFTITDERGGDFEPYRQNRT